MQRVEVDRVKRYRGTFVLHWEVGDGIRVCVVPSPLRVLGGAIPLAIIAACYFLAWFDAISSLLLVFLFGLRFSDVFYEYWLPKFAPGILRESNSLLRGSCQIEFEAIAGPRTSIVIFGGRGSSKRHRRAVIVRVLSGLPDELCVDNNDSDAALLNEPDN